MGLQAVVAGVAATTVVAGGTPVVIDQEDQDDDEEAPRAATGEEITQTHKSFASFPWPFPLRDFGLCQYQSMRDLSRGEKFLKPGIFHLTRKTFSYIINKYSLIV